MPSQTPAKPKKPLQSLVNNYNITKNKRVIAATAVRAANHFAAEAYKRLTPPIKIISWKVSGGKVQLQLDAGIPSNAFGQDHWIAGTGVKGLDGRIDPDFSFISGSTTDVEFTTSLPTRGLTYPKAAYVQSTNHALPNRPDLTTDMWSKQMKDKGKSVVVNNRVLDYYDLPRWFDDLNSNKNGVPTYGAPTSSGAGTFLPGGDGGSRDDVFWYETLQGYADFCHAHYKTLTDQLTAAQNELNDNQAKLGIDQTKTPGLTSDKPPSGPDKGYLGIGSDNKPVIYNLPAVNDMYFRTLPTNDFTVTNGNLSQAVKWANELWAKSGSFKGMFQSYIVPGKLATDANWFKPQDTKNGLGLSLRNINARRYGFQFQYNPSTLTMGYAGAPAVDIGLETSGTDKVNLIGSGVTSSTITFQLLINRMNDFKYIDAILDKSTTAKTSLDVKEIYSHTGNHGVAENTKDGVTSISDELKAIRDLGTMYDIEYLLRTLLGYQLESSMRNRLSADIGYLGAYPVELHLGKNLRYLVIIESFNVSHTIFTQDMIPVFSNIQITASRLPDFAKDPYANISVIQKPAATTTTTGTN